MRQAGAVRPLPGVFFLGQGQRMPPSKAPIGTPVSAEHRLNIIDNTDEEILAVAHPMWEDLIKYSNKGQYGKFIRKFSYDLLLGLNEVEVGKQFAKSELTRSLSEDYDYLGLIRRGEHVTVLYRVRSTKREGEWLGRMVLGYEKGEVRIFAASIF
jgi:hypothetical protein